MSKPVFSFLIALTVLPASMLVAPDAEARHPAYRSHSRVRIAVGLPGVNVRVGPWAVNYRPAPRAGYRWVDGYRQSGAYYPGHWVPIGGPPQAGHVWVSGHWAGDVYVDGYWRAPRKRGHVWVDGYYSRGAWIDGGWAPTQRAAPSAPAQRAPAYEPPPTYEAPRSRSAQPDYDDYDDYDYTEAPDDAPLALPPDYDAPYDTPTYAQPSSEAPASTERQPRVYGDSGRVRGETGVRTVEEPTAAGVWGDPIEEEPLDEGSREDDEAIHHSLDW